PVEDDVGTGSPSYHCCLLLVEWQGSVSEIVVHGGHPTVVVPDDVYVADLGRFFDTWTRQNFLNYGFIPALLFCARQFGMNVCSRVVSSREVLNFGGIELSDFFAN
ncbi:hypothetical protein A2U01_0062640, partial [Trifolium medium]|nr:hypothetical protein [Trifolium medium]